MYKHVFASVYKCVCLLVQTCVNYTSLTVHIAVCDLPTAPTSCAVAAAALSAVTSEPCHSAGPVSVPCWPPRTGMTPTHPVASPTYMYSVHVNKIIFRSCTYMYMYAHQQFTHTHIHVHVHVNTHTCTCTIHYTHRSRNSSAQSTDDTLYMYMYIHVRQYSPERQCPVCLPTQ